MTGGKHLVVSGKVHYALSVVDAVADKIAEAIDVMHDDGGTKMDARAKTKQGAIFFTVLAKQSGHQPIRDKQGVLGVLQKSDRRTVARVKHDAISDRDRLQRVCKQGIEGALDFDLIGNRALRVTNDV